MTQTGQLSRKKKEQINTVKIIQPHKVSIKNTYTEENVKWD